jgi:hypothetical protein
VILRHSMFEDLLHIFRVTEPVAIDVKTRAHSVGGFQPLPDNGIVDTPSDMRALGDP